MNRNVLLSLLGLFVLGALIARELIIHREVNSIQAGLLTSLVESMETSPTKERLERMTSSMIVYNRYLEPVIQTAQGLLWPFSRNSIINTWKRDIHTKIENHFQLKLDSFNDEAHQLIQKARENDIPSLFRLEEIVKLSQNIPSELERIQMIEEELQQIRTSTELADQKLLEDIKNVGKTRLIELKNIIQPMSETELFDFMVSGELYSIIQKPVEEKILQIRQTNLRTASWSEFQEKLNQVVGRKAENIVGQPVVSKRILERMEQTPQWKADSNITIDFIPDPSKVELKNPSKSER